MRGSGRDLRERDASSRRRIGVTAIAAALLAGGCGAQGSTEDACAGLARCGPAGPAAFEGPVLLWSGPEAEVPECPVGAEQTVYLGNRDLDESIECPQCECTAPACAFPAAVWTNAQKCSVGQTMTTQYPLPVGWDGSCVQLSPGPDPVKSHLFAPTTVVPCEPVAHTIMDRGAATSSWGTIAKACAGEESGCSTRGKACPTKASPPPGFRRCLQWAGDGAPVCPTEYPDELIFYDDADARSCSPCECTQTSESVCHAWVFISYDNACLQGVLGMTIANVDDVACGDTGAFWNMSLSVNAIMAVDEPGTCAPSGGEPIGHAEALRPTTFCCRVGDE